MPKLGLKWVGRCFLSIVTPEHAYPLSRLSVHHLLIDSHRKNYQWKEIPFYPTNTKKLNSTSVTEYKTDMNITIINKYKKVNMTEHKTAMNITKIEKYKKPNMMEHKTDINITKINKYKKTEQHFYDGAQSRHKHYWNWQIQKKWAALLRRNTKQNTNTIRWTKQ